MRIIQSIAVLALLSSAEAIRIFEEPAAAAAEAPAADKPVAKPEATGAAKEVPFAPIGE